MVDQSLYFLSHWRKRKARLDRYLCHSPSCLCRSLGEVRLMGLQVPVWLTSFFLYKNRTDLTKWLHQLTQTAPCAVEMMQPHSYGCTGQGKDSQFEKHEALEWKIWTAARLFAGRQDVCCPCQGIPWRGASDVVHASSFFALSSWS